MVKILPSNYNFEIHKSIWRIEEIKKSLKKDNIRLVLQMPQGLQMFACALSDIFEHFTDSEVIIIGDENYGACCIEDESGVAIEADFIIHYGHSCLVPITDTKLKVLYVFVDILIDIDNLVQNICLNFPDKTKQ